MSLAITLRSLSRATAPRATAACSASNLPNRAVASSSASSLASPSSSQVRNSGKQNHDRNEKQRRGAGAFTGAVVAAASIGLLTTVVSAASKDDKPSPSKPGDFAAVRKDIASILDNSDWDDGSIGPVLIRLAWHAAGTYDKATNTGGSNGATMRFDPESKHGANNGLAHARAFLEPIKQKHPWISYADLWTLAGVVAVEEMGGPKVAWRPGRADLVDGSKCPPDGRLPDASKGNDHTRDVFYRMGFNDQEIVALLGAHALGRCHVDRSGFTGPWTFSPITFNNNYYTVLLQEKWTEKKWKGPKQYENKDGSLMMLPTDLAILNDPSFRKWVEVYAKDEKQFFKDFSAAFSKLLELGVPFKPWYQFW